MGRNRCSPNHRSLTLSLSLLLSYSLLLSHSLLLSLTLNIPVVFLWLLEQDWCETILEQMWGSKSFGRGGAFSDLKEQFHSGRTPGSPVHIDVGQICCVPHDVLVIILIKLWRETLQYTPQLVKTVLKEIKKVESSRQILSPACCSMTIDSKSHLVAPAVLTEYPVIQEDAHRRLSQEEQRAFDMASEEERETASSPRLWNPIAHLAHLLS